MKKNLINKTNDEVFGERMIKEDMDSRLIKKQSNSPKICTFCGTRIEPDKLYYLEQGTESHIHSLLARRFCIDCYSLKGESRLLKGQE
jgi:hypothetical protein